MDKFFVQWTDSNNKKHNEFLNREQVITLLKEGGEYPQNYVDMICCDDMEE